MRYKMSSLAICFSLYYAYDRPLIHYLCLSLYRLQFITADLPKTIGVRKWIWCFQVEHVMSLIVRCYDYNKVECTHTNACMEGSSDKTFSKTIPLTFDCVTQYFKSAIDPLSLNLVNIRLWDQHKLLLKEDIIPTDWLMNKSESKYPTVNLSAPHWHCRRHSLHKFEIFTSWMNTSMYIL